MSLKGISILVCTYNGSLQLAATLQHLFAQTNLTAINWEIIIIDNNSNDGTNLIIEDIIINNTNYQIRSFFQPKPGKINAIKMAVEHAKYEYLIICDDDNWLNKDYAYTAFDFLEKNRKIGVIGGKGKPANSVRLPEWIIPHLHNYAAAAQWLCSADITTNIGSVYGAGMVIRKEIYDFVFAQNWPLYLSAMRNGKNLMSGEDTEICYITRLLGFRIYYLEKLEFRHNFPPSKINEKYFLRLNYFFGYGAALLTPYNTINENKTFFFTKTLLLEIYRLARYDLFGIIGNLNLERKKKLKYRLGFICSLIDNRRKIKSLSNYLKKKSSIASTSHHF